MIIIDVVFYNKDNKISFSCTTTNILEVPPSLNLQTIHKVRILHPEGINIGSVELIQIEWIVGQDLSSYAIVPNLGILTLRFPVKNMLIFTKIIELYGKAKLWLYVRPIESGWNFMNRFEFGYLRELH